VSWTPGLPFQGEELMIGDPGLYASHRGTGQAACRWKNP
jgi:hypothetical protein